MAANTVADPEDVTIFAGSDPDEPMFTEEPFVDEPRVLSDDPTMDPGDPKWLPKKYFAAQPKVMIIINKSESDILGDPTGQRRLEVPVSINGFQLNLVKGVPVKVPKDFANHLVDIGAAFRYGDVPDAME